MSGTSTGVLPSAVQSASERSRTSARVSRGRTRARPAPSAVTGLNTCRPTNRSGCPAGLRQVGDRQRRGRGRDDLVGSGDRRQLGQQRRACARVLDDRLDQEGRVGERRQVGGDPDSPGAAVEMLELRAVLGDALLGARRRLIRAGPQQHVAVGGADGRQPARDRARARDGESFLHWSPRIRGRPGLRARADVPQRAPKHVSVFPMVRERSRECRSVTDRRQPSCSVGRTSISLIATCAAGG